MKFILVSVLLFISCNNNIIANKKKNILIGKWELNRVFVEYIADVLDQNKEVFIRISEDYLSFNSKSNFHSY